MQVRSGQVLFEIVKDGVGGAGTAADPVIADDVDVPGLDRDQAVPQRVGTQLVQGLLGSGLDLLGVSVDPDEDVVGVGVGDPLRRVLR